ncbi:MAG: DNA repair protein [Clostridia bacterium]|nr:DNA repair protein [Clostridia bacterium]
MEGRFYVCIDLKSFYASVECVERGLDPMVANLVVADPARGSGAICLAVSPALKALGVRNRCRIFEIPNQMEYITALPRMKLYMEYSARIYSIYLRYISAEDIHIYSIDECFIDVTSYCRLYSKTPKELAVMLTDAVRRETGICATVGIGTNLFLAKVALDITAKHTPDHLGYLDEAIFKKTVWYHKPITDIWNVGRGIAKRLERHGIYDLWGVAHCDEALLYREFGVNAEFLIDHAHGVEPCTIADIHAYRSKSNSISNGQILFEDYSFEDALLVMREMVDLSVLELVERGLVTDSITLSVGYSKDTLKPAGGTVKLNEATNSHKKLEQAFISYFERTVSRNAPIRRLTVGLNHLVDEENATYDLFTDLEAEKREHDLQKTVLDIKKRFGKNAILKGMSLEEKATARIRNKLIGGHNGGED